MWIFKKNLNICMLILRIEQTEENIENKEYSERFPVNIVEILIMITNFFSKSCKKTIRN